MKRKSGAILAIMTLASFFWMVFSMSEAPEFAERWQRHFRGLANQDRQQIVDVAKGGVAAAGVLEYWSVGVRKLTTTTPSIQHSINLTGAHCRAAAIFSGRSPGKSVDPYQSSLAQNGKNFLGQVDFPRNFRAKTDVRNRANFLEMLHGSGLSGLGSGRKCQQKLCDGVLSGSLA